jgi:serralysin
MASPTENHLNSPRVASINAGIATSLLFGTKWGSSSNGVGASITWSVPQGTSWFSNSYSTYGEQYSWYEFSAHEIAAASRALNAWSRVSGVSFKRVDDNKSTVGEIRFAKSSYGPGGSDGHAYSPWDAPRAGDIWMNPFSWNTSGADANKPGTYAFYALLHEVGHALGLKHPFEKSIYNSNMLETQYDNYFYTIMSYTASPWSSTATPDFYPTTPMYLDLVAIQRLYGRDKNVNAGSTTYSFYEGKKYWQTIDDAGGTDTIVYSGSSGCVIDLRPGYFNTLSDPITFSNGDWSRTTVMIGPNVVIERAVGGDGSDTLIGNRANNLLKGMSGDDTLRAGAGSDHLNGGLGNDDLQGGKGKDHFIFNSALSDPSGVNVDRISDFIARDDTIRLDDRVFAGLKTGALLPGRLCFGSGAKDSKDRIIYDKATGELFYDPDGTGAAAQVKFATLTSKPALSAADFYIV